MCYNKYMAQRKTRTFSLTKHQERLIDRLVDSGRYQSSSEVIRDALRNIEDREAERKAAIAVLREKIMEGSRQADRGEVIDGEVAFAQLRRRIRAARKKAG